MRTWRRGRRPRFAVALLSARPWNSGERSAHPVAACISRGDGSANRKRSGPQCGVAVHRRGNFAANGGRAMSLPLRAQLLSAFDPKVLRDEFAILARDVYGRPLVYLDNAASAQKPRAVLQSLAEFAA